MSFAHTFLIALTVLVPAAGGVLALARSEHRALASVNVFHGVVFPDPADPRWLPAGDRYRFGDSDITVSSSRVLSVGDVDVDTGSQAGAYYGKIYATREALIRARALASVEGAVRTAGDGAKASRDQRECAVCRGGLEQLGLIPKDVAEVAIERSRQRGYRLGWEAATAEANAEVASRTLGANDAETARSSVLEWLAACDARRMQG